MRFDADVVLARTEGDAPWPRRAPAERDTARATNVEPAQIVERAREQADRWSDLLDLYFAGWAEANPAKILAATAHDYRFDDPLVGRFSRLTLPVYFERLQARLACAGAIAAQDFGFHIRGPMDGTRRRGRLEFFREAPRLGLTGITVITLNRDGVIADSVAYDLNLACDLLRDPTRGSP
jgi:hypothetical protein